MILLLGVYLLSGGGGVSGQLQDEIPTTQVGPCHRRPDGFARDLNHCSQYFICQNGRAIRGRCPGLLAFDADNEACTWREEVTCFQCPRDQVYALLPVANTCNQLYRCWLGRASIHTCPSNLVFDPRPEVRRCNFVHGTGCEGDSTIVERCPVQDGDTPFYMAHQTSCSSYYVCHGGTPIQRECASGLHFNRVLRICDIPESAGCTSQDVIQIYFYFFFLQFTRQFLKCSFFYFRLSVAVLVASGMKEVVAVVIGVIKLVLVQKPVMVLFHIPAIAMLTMPVTIKKQPLYIVHLDCTGIMIVRHAIVHKMPDVGHMKIQILAMMALVAVVLAVVLAAVCQVFLIFRLFQVCQVVFQSNWNRKPEVQHKIPQQH